MPHGLDWTWGKTAIRQNEWPDNGIYALPNVSISFASAFRYIERRFVSKVFSDMKLILRMDITYRFHISLYNCNDSF